MRHSLEVLKLNEQTFRLLLQAESAARGFQLTQAPVFQRQFETSIIDLERSIAVRSGSRSGAMYSVSSVPSVCRRKGRWP